MSVFEYLLGSLGLGLLHVALGAYCSLFGLGLVGQPRRRSDAHTSPRRRPALIWGGVLIVAFGLFLAAKGLLR